MFYQIKAKLNDGRTVSGIGSGDSPVEALIGELLKNDLKGSDVGRVTIVAIAEGGVKVRKPKAKKNGATAADLAAGANQMASVARENAAQTPTDRPATATRPAPGRAR